MTGNIRLRSLVWKNIKKHTYRNIAIAICFAFVAFSIITATYLTAGASNSLTVGLDRLGADIMVVPANATTNATAFLYDGQPSTFFLDNATLNEVAQIPGVAEVSPELYVATLQNEPCCSAGVSLQLIAFDPSTDFTVLPWLESQLGHPLGQDQIVVGSAVSYKPGKLYLFYGQIFTAVGQLQPTGMGYDHSIFMSLSDAYAMAAQSGQNAVVNLTIEPGQISAVLVKLDSNANATTVASNIEKSIPGVNAITSSDLKQGITSQLSAITQLLYFSTISVSAISIPLIAVISSMASNERKKEIGILRALGGTKKFIFKLFFAEAIIIAAIGGLIGVFVSLVGLFSFQSLIASNLHIPFLLPTITDVLISASSAIGLAVAIGSCASLFPAIKSCTIEPYEAIRGGET